MSKITDLEPKLLWKWFDTICSIPHPSYHEEALVAHVVEWSKERGFFVKQDQAGNVLLRKPATAGHEDVPSVCLQAHFDMVPEKQPNHEHDFLVDPIQPRIVDGHLYATNTTLGADNGIGVASILALFEDDSLEHGALEAILTRNEEVGMEGARNLEPNMLQSKLMINTDTEEWGYLYLGCAGGVDITFSKNYDLRPLKPDSKVFEITLGGFYGGHSGCDIHKERLNAIVHLFKFLHSLYQNVKFNVMYLHAGQARNAIPRDAVVRLAVTSENAPKFAKVFEVERPLYLKTLAAEAGASIEIVEVDPQTLANTDRISCKDMPNLLETMINMPNGVIQYVKDEAFAGTVETSLSVGVLRFDPEQSSEFKYKILARSLDNAELIKLESMLNFYAQDKGFDFNSSNMYSGWKPEYTDFSRFVTQEYTNTIGKPCEVRVIHAGLECGIIKGIYPDLEVVSVGPNIYNPHTPSESTEISSVAEYYQLLINILTNMKQLVK